MRRGTPSNSSSPRDERVANLLAVAKPAAADHPYLLRKSVTPTASLLELSATRVSEIIGYRPTSQLKQSKRSRQKSNAKEESDRPMRGQILLAPVLIGGVASSVAMIDEDGLKSSLANAPVRGGAWYSQPLPPPKNGGKDLTFAIGEGVATVLTVTGIMGWLGAAALSCWNLQAVACFLREKYPEARLVILADVGNGEADAHKARIAADASIATPDFTGFPAKDATDWNDLSNIAGSEEVAAQLEARLSEEPGLFVSPDSPLDTAKQIVKLLFTCDGHRTLIYYGRNWYSWERAYYRCMDADAIRAQMYEILSTALTSTDGKQIELFRPATHKVNNVLDALQSVALIDSSTKSPCWRGSDFVGKPDPMEIVACQNGLLHIPSRRLHPHSPSYFNQNALTFNYDPKAPRPANWIKFLQDIWGNDREAISTLQELFGLFLTCDTSHQKIALIVGPKRSGKGTIARVLTALIGRENVCNPTLAGFNAQFGLAPLLGKQLAIIGDARMGGRADQSAITERLLSISGEDALTVDRKYLSEWTGRIHARFLILTNELPRLSDVSGALASRFIVLTMQKSFIGQEDLSLGGRLMGELPGILNWSLEGWRRLRERGRLIQPKSAADAIEELEVLSSPVTAFIREKCRVEAAARVEVGELYLKWKEWCMEQGRDHCGTVQSFGRDLRAAVPHIRSIQSSANGGKFRSRAYEGIAPVDAGLVKVRKY